MQPNEQPSAQPIHAAGVDAQPIRSEPEKEYGKEIKLKKGGIPPKSKNAPWVLRKFLRFWQISPALLSPG